MREVCLYWFNGKLNKYVYRTYWFNSVEEAEKYVLWLNSEHRILVRIRKESD